MVDHPPAARGPPVEVGRDRDLEMDLRGLADRDALVTVDDGNVTGQGDLAVVRDCGAHVAQCPSAERRDLTDLARKGKIDLLLVYRVDNVDAPMALAVKEPKRSTIGTRAIRYEQTGKATCVQLFFFQSTKKVSDWAIDKNDMALIDPAVAKVLRDDLTEVYKATAPRPATAAAPRRHSQHPCCRRRPWAPRS